MNVDLDPLANGCTAALQHRYYVVSAETSRCSRASYFWQLTGYRTNYRSSRLFRLQSVQYLARLSLAATVVAICEASYPLAAWPRLNGSHWPGFANPADKRTE